MAAQAEKELWLVQRLAVSGKEREDDRVLGSTVMAMRIPEASQAAEYVANLTGKEVKVEIPSSFFVNITESVFLVVSDFSEDVSLQMGSQAMGVASFEFYIGENKNIRRHMVYKLQEPLRLTLPVPYNPNLVCVYFKHGEGWSTEGVTTASAGESGGNLECLTTHLSIFGAIRREELLEVTVSLMPQLGPILLACVSAIFLYLFAVAACLDKRRASTRMWSRESFFVPRSEQPQVYSNDPLKVQGIPAALIRSVAEGLGKTRRAYMKELAFCGGWIMGRHAEGRAHSLAKKLLLGDACRAGAAALELGDEAARYVLTEPALPEVFAEQVKGLWSNSPEEREEVAQRAACLGGKPLNVQREDLWAGLYFTVLHRNGLALAHGRGWDSMLRVFRAQNPLASGYTFSMFTPRKMATMIHSAYFLASLFLASCLLEAAGFFESAAGDRGAIVPLSIVAGILARFVPVLLKAMRTREIRTVDFEGCPEWRAQLGVWRAQDRAVYVLGVLLIGGSLLGMALFLASSGTEGHWSFVVAVIVLALQEFLVLPALCAFVPPLLGMWLLGFASRRAGVTEEDLLKRMAPVFEPPEVAPVPVEEPAPMEPAEPEPAPAPPAPYDTAAAAAPEPQESDEGGEVAAVAPATVRTFTRIKVSL